VIWRWDRCICYLGVRRAESLLHWLSGVIRTSWLWMSHRIIWIWMRLMLWLLPWGTF